MADSSQRAFRQQPQEEYDEEGYATCVSHNAVLDEVVSTDHEELSSKVLEKLLADDLKAYETEEEKRHKE